jgi:threonine/homoserine efflux transporter RhtA
MAIATTITTIPVSKVVTQVHFLGPLAMAIVARSPPQPYNLIKMGALRKGE